jgi:hypothetical protein
MALKLIGRWEISMGGSTMAVPHNLIEILDDQPFLKIRPSHVGIIRLLTKGKRIVKNSNINGSPGIVAVTAARNKASMLIEDTTNNRLMVDAGVEELANHPTKKRACKRNKLNTSTVTFEVPGHEQFGHITTRRAISLGENLHIPMEEESLHKTFEILMSIGIEVTEHKRCYNKSGQWVGRHNKKKTLDMQEGESDDGTDAEADRGEDEAAGASGGEVEHAEAEEKLIS